MQMVAQSELYHVYCHTAEKWMRRNLTWEEVVEYVHNNSLRFGSNKNDTFFSPQYRYGERWVPELNEYTSWPYVIKTYESRDLWVIDSFGRTIDYGTLKLAVRKAENETPPVKKYRRTYRLRHCYFEYRREPVPYTGHSGSHGSFYRWLPQRKRMVAQLRDYPEFLVSSRCKAESVLGRWWDDGPIRGIQRSWKKQGKRSHQWE